MQAIWSENKKIIGLIGAVVGAVLLLGFLLPTDEWAVKINQWLESLGPWALPAFVLIYVIVSVCGLPNVVFLLVAGTVFGFSNGIFSASIADTTAAVACFLLGRTLIRKQVKSRVEQSSQFSKLDRAVAQKGWKILLLSRLAPMIPSNILNYGFSLTQVKFWQYLLCTWVGMLPVIVFYVYLGYFGMSLLGQNSTPQVLMLQVGGVAIAVIAAIYATNLAQQALSSEESDR
ncbi:TVP38/TMEM64 family protein [Romeria aff. gracilis LEGE 07310]|uniref:TVP38/TMEM64 family membrane protein n=1 Tax=Vasconcelosia minhoensis LEGE 07310 TaxID=915328 RepID=A0A8J7ALH7_9CYAN|nr:TVP38/TMEM64 family protein [Romeria gracilis]MBE9077205.1 TVP38/TMEM64 family protein [Romeria aff. gracilis LEGE 07310]